MERVSHWPSGRAGLWLRLCRLLTLAISHHECDSTTHKNSIYSAACSEPGAGNGMETDVALPSELADEDI